MTWQGYHKGQAIPIELMVKWMPALRHHPAAADENYARLRCWRQPPSSAILWS